MDAILDTIEDEPITPPDFVDSTETKSLIHQLTQGVNAIRGLPEIDQLAEKTQPVKLKVTHREKLDGTSTDEPYLDFEQPSDISIITDRNGDFLLHKRSIAASAGGISWALIDSVHTELRLPKLTDTVALGDIQPFSKYTVFDHRLSHSFIDRQGVDLDNSLQFFSLSDIIELIANGDITHLETIAGILRYTLIESLTDEDSKVGSLILSPAALVEVTTRYKKIIESATIAANEEITVTDAVKPEKWMPLTQVPQGQMGQDRDVVVYAATSDEALAIVTDTSGNITFAVETAPATAGQTLLLPGGQIEVDEDPATAGIREVLEEIRIKEKVTNPDGTKSVVETSATLLVAGTPTDETAVVTSIVYHRGGFEETDDTNVKGDEFGTISKAFIPPLMCLQMIVGNEINDARFIAGITMYLMEIGLLVPEGNKLKIDADKLTTADREYLQQLAGLPS